MIETLSDLQYKQAEALYTFSDLNGFQVEDAGGWESIENGEEVVQLWRTIYVSNITEESAPHEESSPVTLSVHFKPQSHLIDHAYIDGEEITDLARLDKE